MYVIGTAGHVDHGKSTLVAALTGIHPDRLKEEREREMTIDLGFAWMDMSGGEAIGIIDVPGHRDFIENMLAGVGGIDAVLFVIAADEGIMPQTREHLTILDILGIKRGVVALTKTDLIDDEEWLALVEAEIHQVVATTCLSEAPVVRVSARSGAGLGELKTALAECLRATPSKPDLGRPRLPIDRIFTISGFGTVVTGTLQDGCLRIGDDVEILPKGLLGRIRGLQSYNNKETLAQPGGRTAVNISGVDVEQIRRGDVLTLRGQYTVTQRVDVTVRLPEDATTPLKHDMEVKFFSAALEVVARTRVLGSERIDPGGEGWLQLELRQPAVLARGDHYIIRRPSPGETLGGGQVLDPHPKRRHKRFSPEVIERLSVLRRADPEELLLQAIASARFTTLPEAAQAARIKAGEAGQALQALLHMGKVVILEEGQKESTNRLVAASHILAREKQRLVDEVQQYHLQFPLRRGITREVLKSRAGLIPRVFPILLQQMVEEGNLKEENRVISLPDHRIIFDSQQEEKMEQRLRAFRASPFTPPAVKECVQQLGEDLYQAMVETGRLVQVSEDVVFLSETFDHMLGWVKKNIQDSGAITVAQFRDQFNTSRKYALAFLEHLDRSGITVRDGDIRRLRSPKNG